MSVGSIGGGGLSALQQRYLQPDQQPREIRTTEQPKALETQPPPPAKAELAAEQGYGSVDLYL